MAGRGLSWEEEEEEQTVRLGEVASWVKEEGEEQTVRLGEVVS